MTYITSLQIVFKWIANDFPNKTNKASVNNLKTSLGIKTILSFFAVEAVIGALVNVNTVTINIDSILISDSVSFIPINTKTRIAPSCVDTNFDVITHQTSCTFIYVNAMVFVNFN